MLYGFGFAGAIIVVAADTLSEFNDASMKLDRLDIQYRTASLTEIVEGDEYDGLSAVPYIITGGSLTRDLLEIIPRDEAISRHNGMIRVSETEDDVDRIFTLYQQQQPQDAPENNEIVSPADMMVGEDSRILFATYCDLQHGTVAVLSSEAAFHTWGKPTYLVFCENARSGDLFNLPPGFDTELLLGCFSYRGSPLGARRALLQHGFVEDRAFTTEVLSRLNDDPCASSMDEAMFALDLVEPLDPKTLLFALAAHPHRASTFVAIAPELLWTNCQDLPIGVYLSPIVTHFLPTGFAEIVPGIFEVVKPLADVRLQVLKAGLTENPLLGERLIPHIESADAIPAFVPPTPAPAIDIDALAARWDRLGGQERLAALPNAAISFCLLEAAYGASYVFLVPTAHFALHHDLYTRSLDLGSRIPAVVTEVGANVFRAEGVDALQLNGNLAKAGFIDDYGLSLRVVEILYSTDLAREIGFDPLA